MLNIFIGLLIWILPFVVNYFCLYKMVDAYGKPAKHYRITYIGSWFIASIPFIGIFYTALHIFYMVVECNYHCCSKLFDEY